MKFSPGEGSAELARNVRDQDAQIGLHEWDTEIKGKQIGELEQQATTDPWTGLDNVRSFQDKLEQTLRMVRESKKVPEEHRRESQKVLALVSLDIDRFKSINDTLGHAAGDEVLRRFAKLLRESVRGSDSVARVGGEEFMVIMPGANTESAARHADELRKKVQSLVFDAYPNLKVTASFGVVSSAASEDPGTLRGYVDKALYDAKNGRNRVVVYEGENKKNVAA